MKIVELRDISNEMLSNFVDKLGLDGKAYVESTKCPMIFGDLGVPGKFYTAGDMALKRFLESEKLPQDQKDYILEEGLIVIDSDYKDMPIDADIITTCIHEKLHANRMLLAHMVESSNDEINPMFYDKGRFVENNTELTDKFIDPNQDILLGSIDTSKKNVEHYQNLSDDEKDDLYFANDNYDNKLQQQYHIDEALVELMALVAYQLSSNKFNNIMDIVKDINEHYDADDIHSMTNIILRHNDLELFKWMIDPLTYQNGDIHYNFFAHYITNEDQNDVTLLFESDDIMVDDDELDKIAMEEAQKIR